MYLRNVFPKCIWEMYLRNVFEKCIWEMYRYWAHYCYRSILCFVIKSSEKNILILKNSITKCITKCMHQNEMQEPASINRPYQLLIVLMNHSYCLLFLIRHNSYRMRVGTQVILGSLEVKGEATDASASDREIPAWAVFSAPQSFAPSPHIPT